MSEKKYYMYRLTFKFSDKGVINFAEGENETANSLTYEQPNGFPVRLQATGPTLNDSYQFQLTQGGFSSAATARNEAKENLAALALLAAELGVGVEAGPLFLPDYSSERAAPGVTKWSEGLFEDVEQANNAQTVAQKLGITVLRQRNADETVMSMETTGTLRQTALRPLGFIQVLVQMGQQNAKFNERTSLALELYSLSFFEHSARASFLTLIQMLESLAPKIERSDGVKSFVDQLQLLTKEAVAAAQKAKQVSDQAAYDGILGALSWLKNESITNSIKSLVEECLCDSTIDGMTPSKFIKHCYEIRSSLTHSGKTKLTPAEFATLLHRLRSVCLRVLRHAIGYAPLVVPEEAVAPPSLQSQVEFT
jgi:hypothetical protein